MSTEQNKLLARAFFDYANHGDMESCLALLSNDLVWKEMGSTRFSGTHVGKDAVLCEVVAPLFSRLKSGIHTTIENMLAEGDQVVIQSAGKAETLEGEPYDNCYCHFFTIKDGKICEVVEYMDTALVDKVFGKPEET